MSFSICESCGKEVSKQQGGVHVGTIDEGYRFVCSACYNATMAEYTGINFKHPDFQPLVLKDIDDRPHEFHFDTSLMMNGVSIKAYEIRNGERKGYEFQIADENQEIEPLILFGRLLEKMRRALSRKHLRISKLGTHIAEHGVVRGCITWDDDTGGRLPGLVIDGEELSWDQFGRMWMTYEGFQFKVEIKDMSDEV